MKLLIQHGADVNAQVSSTKTYSLRISRAPSSNEGMTALHVAARSGNVDVVKFLIDKGANTGIVDGNGHTPIWSAQVHQAMLRAAEDRRRLPRQRATLPFVPPPEHAAALPGRKPPEAEARQTRSGFALCCRT